MQMLCRRERINRLASSYDFCAPYTSQTFPQPIAIAHQSDRIFSSDVLTSPYLSNHQDITTTTPSIMDPVFGDFYPGSEFWSYSTDSSISTGSLYRYPTREEMTTRLFSEPLAAVNEGFSSSIANQLSSTSRLSGPLLDVMSGPSTGHTLGQVAHGRRQERDRMLFEMLQGRHVRDLGLDGLPRELHDGLDEFLETLPRRSDTQRFGDAPPPPYSVVDTFVAHIMGNRTREETLAALAALEEDDRRNKGKLPAYSIVDPLIILPTYEEITRTKDPKGKKECKIWKGVKKVGKIVCNCALTPLQLDYGTNKPTRWRAFT
jgi:hypothetical protein